MQRSASSVEKLHRKALELHEEHELKRLRIEVRKQAAVIEKQRGEITTLSAQLRQWDADGGERFASIRAWNSSSAFIPLRGTNGTNSMDEQRQRKKPSPATSHERRDFEAAEPAEEATTSGGLMLLPEARSETQSLKVLCTAAADDPYMRLSVQRLIAQQEVGEDELDTSSQVGRGSSAGSSVQLEIVDDCEESRAPEHGTEDITHIWQVVILLYTSLAGGYYLAIQEN